jgi:hypothetical protein
MTIACLAGTEVAIKPQRGRDYTSKGDADAALLGRERRLLALQAGKLLHYICYLRNV